MTHYKVIQYANKSLEALIVIKSLALTIVVNYNNLPGHAGTNETYSLIKRHFFWKGMCKGIDKFTQNSHICRKKSNLQKQSYSFFYIKLLKRLFDSIACDLTPFSQVPSKTHMYMCILTNYPIAIPIPIKTAEIDVQAYL